MSRKVHVANSCGHLIDVNNYNSRDYKRASRNNEARLTAVSIRTELPVII